MTCAFSTSQLPKVLRDCQLLIRLTSSVLRATTECTFSTAQLPKVLPTWGVFCFLKSKYASRHNGVQLFISHLARWLRTRRFSDSPEPQIIWKTQCLATSTFSHTCIFFRLTRSLLWSSLLWSSPLPTAFPSVHIVGSLTSKLSSVNGKY